MASSCFVTGPELFYDVAREVLEDAGREIPVFGTPFKVLHAAEAAVETLRNVHEARTVVAENPLAFFSVSTSKLKHLGRTTEGQTGL